MDSIDRSILFHLQRDGRQPNNTLADLVGLSPSPCLRRVRQLEADGVIEGYAAVLDRRAVGCGFEAIVWVTLAQVTRESMTTFEDAVGEIDSIIEVLRMMGQPDYLLRVVAADADSFETIYIDRLAQLPHVKTLTSQSAMKIVKRTHVLPMPQR